MNNEERKFYVYGYIRLDTNTYFYIGKGKNNRYLRLDNRKKHFKNILNLTECVVEILYDNLTNEEALQLEVDTIYDLVFNEGYSIDIKGICKNDNGQHLVNCTWGGDGTCGLSIKQSQETIDKRVAKNTGKKRTEQQRENLKKARNKRLREHPEEMEKFKKGLLRKGIKLSQETKNKISEAHKGQKMSEDTKAKLKEYYNNLSEEEKEAMNEKRSATLGTHVYCKELNMKFTSLNKAIKYIKGTYGILFNRRSLVKILNKESDKDWYGEININGELVKLHWEYC